MLRLLMAVFSFDSKIVVAAISAGEISFTFSSFYTIIFSQSVPNVHFRLGSLRLEPIIINSQAKSNFKFIFKFKR